MGCGITSIVLAVLAPILWFNFRETLEGSSGNFSGLALVIPFSSALLIIGTVLIAKALDKPKLMGSAIRGAIREALGKAANEDIMIEELTNLNSLNAEFKSITDLALLKRCANLTTLNLSNNLISDISPLSSLTKLSEVRLNNNRIHDISPLVRNSVLGKGTKIWLKNNNLDLTEDSDDMQNIKTLQDRGVAVIY
jgi:hypothetical protein